MDKSNVIVYAEGLAKERNLSDKQKNELIETLTEATSVLGGDKDRIEEALTFLDDKIQNSYKQFFTDTGIVATEIRSTTMIKVEEIIKEVEQSKIAQERAERQAGNSNEMLNSYMDKAMNMDVKEADLFNLPEAEVVASIKGALTTYFDGLELPKGFLEDLSKDIYDAQKRKIEIDARVEAGEKREDVESEMFPDELSRSKHEADLEIAEEIEVDKYYEIEDIIYEISGKYELDYDEAEKRYFEGKPRAEYIRFKLEQRKERARMKQRKEDSRDEEVKNKNGGLKRRERKKFAKLEKYIVEAEAEIEFYQSRIAELRSLGKISACANLEKTCSEKMSYIEGYKKMLAKLREKSEIREAKRREDINFHQEHKDAVEAYMKQRFYS